MSTYRPNIKTWPFVLLALVGILFIYDAGVEQETAEPENYYENLPEIKDKDIFILEPMLATGGSLSFAIDTVKKYEPRKIYALTVISSPEGIKYIQDKHSDITLLTASIDEKLNENYYIVPGLGDMGDRLFGTV